MKLKCYFAGCKDFDEFEFFDVVFAYSHRAARKLVWNDGREIRDRCSGEFFSLTLSRQKEFDGLATGELEYVVKDAETLREMGWAIEGDNCCAQCGLAEFGIEKYAVCCECDQCSECGHLTGCENQ